jgi:hypothetical protein
LHLYFQINLFLRYCERYVSKGSHRSTIFMSRLLDISKRKTRIAEYFLARVSLKQWWYFHRYVGGWSWPPLLSIWSPFTISISIYRSFTLLLPYRYLLYLQFNLNLLIVRLLLQLSRDCNWLHFMITAFLLHNHLFYVYLILASWRPYIIYGPIFINFRPRYQYFLFQTLFVVEYFLLHISLLSL